MAKKNTIDLEKLSYISTIVTLIVALLNILFLELKNLWFSDYEWWAISISTYFFVTIAWFIALFSPQKDKHLIWLKNKSYAKSYIRLLETLLGSISNFLSKGIKKNNGKYPISYYWSTDLLGLTLLLAAIYPLISLILQWVASGESVFLNDFEIFKGLSGLVEQTLVSILLIGVIYLLNQIRYAKDKDFKLVNLLFFG